MIDISAIETRVAAVVEASGARILRTGASEKSDAIYINIRKPKLVSDEYGVLESWAVLVRVSNHFNETNTEDRLTADLFVNIYLEDHVDVFINEVEDFLVNAVCQREEDDPEAITPRCDDSPSNGN